MDTMVSAGRILFLYQNVAAGTEDAKGPEKKYRATRFGRVTKLLAGEGDIVQPGYMSLLTLHASLYNLRVSRETGHTSPLLEKVSRFLPEFVQAISISGKW